MGARAAHQLRVSVTAQQRSMAALRSATNARINQTNKHVSANAAQIKENAKAARKSLAAAVAKYDRKVAGARELAQKGRSKLAAQLYSAIAKSQRGSSYTPMGSGAMGSAMGSAR